MIHHSISDYPVLLQKQKWLSRSAGTDTICRRRPSSIGSQSLGNIRLQSSTAISARWEISLNQPQIRLYLPLSDWFGSKRKSVWILISWKIVNTIWFRVDLIRFRKDFSVCATIRRAVVREAGFSLGPI